MTANMGSPTHTTTCRWGCCFLFICILISDIHAASTKSRHSQNRRRNQGDRNHGNRNQDNRGDSDRVVSGFALFPERKSWCEPRPIQQVVDHPGCTTKNIDNLMCLGQCYSYRIPRTLPEDTAAQLQYCDSCQPSRSTWQKITLECSMEDIPFVDKLIEIVQDCACSKCLS